MILLQATVSMWTILAAFAAVLSAISAFRSSRIAKRALSITRQTYQDRQANFTLYLIDGFRWTSKENDKRKFLLFHITISNKSDSKSSYRAEVEIEYIREDNSVARVIMTHNEDLQKLILNKSLTIFSNDIRIDEKGMQSKWLIFDQPAAVFQLHRIEKYSIKITDTQGNSQTVDSILLKELNDV
jgi:hypothetical protein